MKACLAKTTLKLGWFGLKPVCSKYMASTELNLRVFWMYDSADKHTHNSHFGSLKHTLSFDVYHQRNIHDGIRLQVCLDTKRLWDHYGRFHRILELLSFLIVQVARHFNLRDTSSVKHQACLLHVIRKETISSFYNDGATARQQLIVVHYGRR